MIRRMRELEKQVEELKVRSALTGDRLDALLVRENLVATARAVEPGYAYSGAPIRSANPAAPGA